MEADFLALACLAPASWAVSNLIDNHVLWKAVRDPVAYDVITIWMGSAAAALIYAMTRVSFELGPLVVGAAVGFSFAFLYVLYDVGMMREEGTNVVSIVYTLPLYVAVLSWAFLGETLTPLRYVGIVLLTLSAFLVLYRRLDKANPALAAVLVFALGSAITRVASKSALGSVDVWSYLFWFTVGEGIGSLALAARPTYRRRVVGSVRSLEPGTVALLAGTAAFTFLGYLFFYSAISSGSVAVASGITALQPSFLLIFSSALLWARPSWLPADSEARRGGIRRKSAAVILIVVGTWALTGI